MPTFETCPRFTTDLQHLTPAQRQRFRRVVLDAFVPDLRTGRQFRPGLRIKGVRCAPGVYELTWAPDGRASDRRTKTPTGCCDSTSRKAPTCPGGPPETSK
ncbi:hypothetical protein ABZ527_37925, partial [Streptomyces griseofuscus]|uniref:hypothetical protein n=1 Tax=Streptomyces griseofuscus TaxID=146922 RepID=UPI0033F3F53F